MVRIRVHANGHPTPTFLLKLPGSWAELVAAASERVGGASSSLTATRLFLSTDGAEIGSLEDLEEGDVVSVALDGEAHCRAEAVASAPPQLPLLPPPEGATSGMNACTTIASGIVKGMHKGAELLDDARTRGDTAEICNLLRQLARVPTVSRDLLAETGVGVVVGKLKRHEDDDVASMARQLVEHWKAMLELEVSSGMSGPGVVERQLELELEQLQARRRQEAARATALAREAALAATEAKRAARAELEARAAALAREAARADARARQAAAEEEEAREAVRAEAVRAEAEARERRGERSLLERRGERLAREPFAKEHVEGHVEGRVEREAAGRESQVREAADRRKAERREAERRDERRAALEAERQAEAEARERAALEAEESAKRKAAEREEANEERLAAIQRRAMAERRTARDAAIGDAAIGEAAIGEAEAETVAFVERLRSDQAEAAREVRRLHRSKTPADRAASRGRGRPSRMPVPPPRDPSNVATAEASLLPFAGAADATLGANGHGHQPAEPLGLQPLGLGRAAGGSLVGASDRPSLPTAGGMPTAGRTEQSERRRASTERERIAIAGSLIENYAMDSVEGVRSEACMGGRHRRGAPERCPERVSGGDGSSVGAAGATLDHPTTRRADGPAARRPRLKVGDLVLGAPLRQGRDEERRSERIEERDYGLGLVLAASDTAYSTRFMWRYPLGSAGNGAPVGVCDNLCIDRRDLRLASISRVKSTPPPPYLPSDRDILEGGQLAAEAAGFRFRHL
jgi:hypothetical protein